jgi:hypothetical protein
VSSFGSNLTALGAKAVGCCQQAIDPQIHPYRIVSQGFVDLILYGYAEIKNTLLKEQASGSPPVLQKVSLIIPKDQAGLDATSDRR